MSLSVIDVKCSKVEVDLKHPEVAEEMKALADELKLGGSGLSPSERVLPLVPERLEITVANAPTAVANALRRVICSEMKGRCLTFPQEGFDPAGLTTDEFMSDADFLRHRLEMVPLRPVTEAEAKSVRLRILAVNRGRDPLSVYAKDLELTEGKLSSPLCNPAIVLAVVQPGRALCIEGIHLVEASGDQRAVSGGTAAMTVACRVACVPLDLKEVPREAMTARRGEAAGLSGYVESSLVARPMRHLISAVLPATPRARFHGPALALDACTILMGRLRAILHLIETELREEADEPHSGGTPEGSYLQIAHSQGGRTKAVLSVKGETVTVGYLIEVAVVDLNPNISYVAQSCIKHEGRMVVTLYHSVAEPEEAGLILLKATRRALSQVIQLEKGIREKTAQ